MRSPAEELAALSEADQAEFIESLTEDEAEALLTDWRNFSARPDQIMPNGDWDIWLILSGRGWGKTRTGAEAVREVVKDGTARRIALVAETAADGRDVMVEGDSGILACHPEHERPLYEPSKRRLTWRNGAVATLFNATEPDQLRGPQFDFAWSDELAKWKYARETWDMLQFGLRLGSHPRQIVTTTPRPIELVKAIMAGKEGEVHPTRGRTYDNAANLADTFLKKIELRYAGTRLGRQELDGDILGDLPNALWTQDGIDRHRLSKAPPLGRVVIGIDPSVEDPRDTDGEIDEAGIIGVGRGQNDDGNPTAYVLEDASVKGPPNAWARAAVALYHKLNADAIVAEVNNGGEMVAMTIRTVDPNVRVIKVRASRGKHVRAEPISAIYEQGRAHHVGAFPELESELTQFTSVGYQGERSPNRADALVWAATELVPQIVRKIEPPKRQKRRGAAGGWMG